jgi:hypothetical protein
MLKAADSLAKAGYAVSVVSTNFEPWAAEADQRLRQTRQWSWSVVDYSRDSAPFTRWRSSVRFRMSRWLAKQMGPGRLPFAIAARASSRVFPELVRQAGRAPVDMIYGGGGALAATVAATRNFRVPFAVDLEDFHSGEAAEDSEGTLSNAIAERLENRVFNSAAFLTCASEQIAEAYVQKYGRRPIVINNTFSLPAAEPDLSRGAGAALKLYWFSQTIGPGRGLEECVQAAGLAAVKCELHLRGKPVNGYGAVLERLAANCAKELVIVWHPPIPPDEMVSCCYGYDVGLALEQPQLLNRALCLTNKIFTYILAGLPVVVTDTPGQHSLALDLGRGAWLYRPGDLPRFAEGLRLWAQDNAELQAARKAAWQAACRRWHWEHPQEEGALLAAVQEVLSPQRAKTGLVRGPDNRSRCGPPPL